MRHDPIQINSGYLRHGPADTLYSAVTLSRMNRWVSTSAVTLLVTDSNAASIAPAPTSATPLVPQDGTGNAG